MNLICDTELEDLVELIAKGYRITCADVLGNLWSDYWTRCPICGCELDVEGKWHHTAGKNEEMH